MNDSTKRFAGSIDLSDLVGAVTAGVSAAIADKPDSQFAENLGGITIGLILEPAQIGGWAGLARSSAPNNSAAAARSLTVQDHTRVMQEIMAYPLHLMKQIGPRRDTPPTEEEVMDALLKVRVYSNEVRGILLRVRESHVETAAERRRAADEHADLIFRLETQLKGQPINGMIAIIEGFERDYADIEAVRVRLRLAREILEDGASTIYAPDHPFHDIFRSVDGYDLAGLGLADGLGAIIGGPGGAVVASATGLITELVVAAM